MPVGMAGKAKAPRTAAKHRNNLQHLRQAFGLTQQQVGDVLGVTQTQAARFEQGINSLSIYQVRQLAAHFDVPDWAVITPGAQPIPVLYRIRKHGFEAPPGKAALQLARADGHVKLRGSIEAFEQCFAAEVIDNSADLIYPRGSLLVARRTRFLGPELEIDGRTNFIARLFATNYANQDTSEILVGLLDHQVDGTLALVLRSSDRQLGTAKLRARESAVELSEPTRTLLANRARPIAYSPQLGDLGEIIGRVETLAERRE